GPRWKASWSTARTGRRRPGPTAPPAAARSAETPKTKWSRSSVNASFHRGRIVEEEQGRVAGLPGRSRLLGRSAGQPAPHFQPGLGQHPALVDHRPETDHVLAGARAAIAVGREQRLALGVEPGVPQTLAQFPRVPARLL